MIGSVYRLIGKRKVANLQVPSTVHSQSTPELTAQIKVSAQRNKRFLKGVRNAGESILNKFTAVFVVFLAVASVSLASIVNMLPNIWLVHHFLFWL